MARRWRKSRFDGNDDEPLGPMANLVDLMLVFACGLIAALISMSSQLQEHFKPERQALTELTSTKELPKLPEGLQGGADGYESVGQVYRDPKTGKLILIGQ
ncbi:hypothetical protein LCGC14_0675190 [marine sediment metagenome]|uniref:DUF2149 domain-containing protein n=1 Tax=marine sediment metagenome TaxID=412755 RepID=A0A0F9R9Z4_9ZZZZ